MAPGLDTSPENISPPAIANRGAGRQASPAVSPSLFAKEPRRKLAFPKRRPASSGRNFRQALYRVLKKTVPEAEISAKGMAVMNDMMLDMFDQIATAAAEFAERDGRTTMTARDVRAATRVLLPGQLFGHSFYESTRALAALDGVTARAGQDE